MADKGQGCVPETSTLKWESEGRNQNKPAKAEGRGGQIQGEANPESQVVPHQKPGTDNGENTHPLKRSCAGGKGNQLQPAQEAGAGPIYRARFLFSILI